MSAVNLLCFMALETPLVNGQDILNIYLRILNLDTWFEDILGRMDQDVSDESSQIPEKHRPRFRELAKLISEELKGQKDAFINYVTNVVYPASEAQAKERLEYEKNLKTTGNTDSKIQGWQKYIKFEISQNQLPRAKYLYEKALSSSIDMQNNS